MNFSIVLVVKNESANLRRVVESVRGLTDNVVVCDTGSTDDTLQIAESLGVDLHHIPWEGYGKSKNKASGFAKYDWVLSLDGDEQVDAELYEALKNWKPGGDNVVYRLKWKNYLGGRHIRYGESGLRKNRLYNRRVVNWDSAIAHENLVSNSPISHVDLQGRVNHYCFANYKEYFAKMNHSAMIMGEEMHSRGKQVSAPMIVVKSLFSFISYYFINLGLLDGWMGLVIATTRSGYTFKKYVRLRELNSQRV
jgi:glycosyltransferase involved in cell wall biosynthesis